MNNIPKTQNEQRQLERLAAQRQLYSTAKKRHIVQIFLTVVIPVVLAVISMIQPLYSTYGAIFGVIALIVDVLFLEPKTKALKIKAAKIQELFDCTVLELPPSPLKTVENVTVEEVLHYYNIHIKKSANIEKIKNWYTDVEKLPLPIARIICQRANFSWDSKLRVRYCSFLLMIGLTVISAILILGILSDLTLIQVILIISGLIPFFQFCIKQYNENVEAANRLNELVIYAKNLWEQALQGFYTDDMLAISSRRLQDEIYEHRCKSPLILNIFYNFFRDDSESLMNKTGAILAAEWLDKNKGKD